MQADSKGESSDSLSKLTGPMLVVKGKIHQAIIIYLLEILVLRLRMLHCFNASLFIQAAQMPGSCGIRRLRSRGFGFVSFRNQQDAQSAFNNSFSFNRKWLGSRQIRCNWATKGATGDDKQNSDSKSVMEATYLTSEDGQDKTNDDAPKNNAQYTTVYVGNLAMEVLVLLKMLEYKEKGFGFVRYSTHAEAARAIQLGNSCPLFGKPIKCSWGSNSTPPGSNSTPLPPPAAPSFIPADFAAYERQLALAKMGGPQPLMGMGGPEASQPIYDGAYPNMDTSQHLMYYH